MQTTTSIMKLPDILKSVSPYIDTNMDVEDMWKLANVAYKSNMSGSEQVPPMKLLREETIGGAAVLTVPNEDNLKAYIQEVMNPQAEEEPAEGTLQQTMVKTPLETVRIPNPIQLRYPPEQITNLIPYNSQDRPRSSSLSCFIEERMFKIYDKIQTTFRSFVSGSPSAYRRRGQQSLPLVQGSRRRRSRIHETGERRLFLG